MGDPRVAVAGITVAALAVVGVLAVLAARSAPDEAARTASTAGKIRAAIHRQPARGTALPADTGHGRRIVYALLIDRVWVVDEDGAVQRTYSVPHRQPNLSSGTYRVVVRKTSAPAGDGAGRFRYLVQMEQGKGGPTRTGFCSVPLTRSGRPAKVDHDGGIEGGAVSSPGIQQKLSDARYLWRKAPIGTTVVVIP